MTVNVWRVALIVDPASTVSDKLSYESTIRVENGGEWQVGRDAADEGIHPFERTG